jgi:hypothetical protein
LGNSQRHDAKAELFGNGKCAFLIRFRQDADEFLAAKTSHQIGSADDDLVDRFCYLSQTISDSPASSVAIAAIAAVSAHSKASSNDSTASVYLLAWRARQR